MKNIISLSVCLFTLLTPLAGADAAAAEACPSYGEVTEKLGKRYSEQKLFSGFADRAGVSGASAVYEFWGNPERGSWSLIANKLMLFQDGGRQFTRQCAFIVGSGKRFKQYGPDAASTPTAARGGDGDVRTRCMARARHAELLHDRYRERPLLTALAGDQSLLEIYAGTDSWTVTRTNMRELKNPLDGSTMRDRDSGQEIRRLCSSALFSGISWGLDQTDRQSDSI